MEKIVIKPVSREIVIRGKPEDGHVDVFSYNYEGSAVNSLGGLFIVGHVQPASEDTTYMINLVASLAKREYYSKPEDAPKDAFSRTLKKINEVLQDFFRNKDLKVNIGIFTVAGENIFISRLGKFKIILARDNQDIDILNNINLFNKEHIQEKEFSNIISGKIMPQDKIFAFYPARSIVAREKNIKSYLLDSGADEFAEKLNSIKQNSENFLCAAVHITINRYKEEAVIKIPQPKELSEPKMILAKVTKQREKTIIPQEIPNVRPADSPQKDKKEIKIDLKELGLKAETPPPPISIPPAAEVKPEPLQSSNVYYPGGRSLSSPENSPSQPPLPHESSTFIRPTEFSSAKKDNFFDVIFKKFKPSGVYIIGAGKGQGFSKKKLIVTGSAIVAVVSFLVVAKLTFIPALPVPGIENAQDKALSTLLDGVKSKIELAQSYKDQNNLFDARRILIESLNALASSAIPSSDKIEETRRNVFSLLDQIDKAVEFSPSLAQEISQTFGDDFQIWSFAWSLAKGDMKIQKPEMAGLISYYPSQDNLYILAQDGIFKIVDAAKGKTNAVSWLNKDASLPPAAILLAVDSRVFILTESGIMDTFYKGDKVSEINTGIPVNKNSILLTTSKSTSLYLVDKELNRIYVLSKDSGALTKTLKIAGDPFIVGGSIGDDETIYLISKDNKVWKVTP